MNNFQYWEEVKALVKEKKIFIVKRNCTVFQKIICELCFFQSMAVFESIRF